MKSNVDCLINLQLSLNGKLILIEKEDPKNNTEKKIQMVQEVSKAMEEKAPKQSRNTNFKKLSL